MGMAWEKKLGVQWEMGMLVRECEGMGTWNTFPLTLVTNSCNPGTSIQYVRVHA